MNVIDAWAERKHTMLVEDTLRMCAEYLTVARREETADHQEKNLPQPGAPREAPDDGAVDHRARDGRVTPAGGPLQKDGGPGDVGATRQTPVGPDTNRCEPGIVDRPPPGVNTRGNHR